MNQYKDMTDEYLIKNYVPDVYQKSIFTINYEQLKNASIKVISFDIDDTIVPIEKHNPTKAAITLFENLKHMGFEVILMSNAKDERVQRFGEKLKVECISRALKPNTNCLDDVRNIYIQKHDKAISPNEMAHVGNSMTRDVAVGKAYGAITCLVRDVGRLPDAGKILRLPKTEGQKLREVLKERGIWRKHHKNAPDDQYYQLEDTYLAQNNKKD